MIREALALISFGLFCSNALVWLAILETWR